ncbi:MAG: hypothetical protein ACPL4K_00965, partial [Candidatus Margulisiibacteriota bacterium]
MKISSIANFNEIANVRSTNKSASDQVSDHGLSFVQSFRSVVQSANLQVADGGSSAMLNLNRNKEEKLEKLFSFTETEEEIIDESL